MSDERYVDAPPAGAEGWREVWREDRRYRPGGVLQKLLHKLFRRASAADADRQRDFNLATLDLVGELRGAIAAVRHDLRGDFEALQDDMRRADEGLARELTQIRELIPIAARRNDALISALDQKIETLAVRMRDATNLTVASASSPPSRANDLMYRRLEDGLRGSASDIREAMRHYADLAASHQPAIDAGCGRGEFLELCKEAGTEARGFDTNERSVADLKQREFDVALAGIPECFSSIAAGSVGSLLAAHVVEHLPVDALFALFREAARVLRSGGLLMIETPNAESLLMSASEFWRDPTHLAPRHPAALTLLAREHGFEVVEIRAVHPFPEGMRLTSAEPSTRAIVELINERLFGAQDLRMILRKA